MMSDPSKSPVDLSSRPWTTVWAMLLATAVAFLWSYWPTLVELSETWDREPDYSHGYLVLPLCLLFLWLRRDSMPPLRTSYSAVAFGVLLLAGSGLLRWVGGYYFLTPLDGWSIPLWAIGLAFCLGGWSMAWWAMPPILFLLFMVPLPFRMETMISEPLQKVAAELSSFLLRCLGQPAFAEETTILLDGQILSVEQSCSGLRIFVGILALACGYLIAFRSEFWEATLLMIGVVPVALMANASRIVVTAILFRNFSSETAQHFSHDLAGWLMIPLAAMMLGGIQWYLSCLMKDVDAGQVRDTVRHTQPSV